MAHSPAKPQATICLLPRLQGLGGPASFRARLVDGLAARGVAVSDDPDAPGLAAMLVIGGTRDLPALLRARRKGLRVVQRLNGMNWIHKQRRTGLKHYLRSEANNALLAFIRARLAHRIVYQSEFSRDWWARVYGDPGKAHSVVYNGIDLARFTPQGPEQPPADRCRVLLVEGRLGGGNEPGLENAVALARLLAERHGLAVELAVAGEVPARLRELMQRLPLPPGASINWLGVLKREQVAAADRSAHLLFSADLNAACPNSVIEALACGLPVVAFDTGALRELVQGGAGEVVAWGGDHWRLEPPDLPALANAAARILRDNPAYRLRARARAEAAFALDQTVAGYLDALLGDTP